MKTIVIPSNCGPECINHIKTVLDLYSSEQVKCIFLYVRPVPADGLSLVMLGREKSRYHHFDIPFQRTVADLRKKYGARLQAVMDHIYGDSPAVFRHYLQHQQADLVIYNKQEWQENAKGLDIFRMVKRCGCELMYIAENAAQPAGEVLLRNTAKAPASVVHRFNAIEQRLIGIPDFAPAMLISRKISNLSRYFLNEHTLDDMLVQANGSLLLLRHK